VRVLSDFLTNLKHLRIERRSLFETSELRVQRIFLSNATFFFSSHPQFRRTWSVRIFKPDDYELGLEIEEK